MPNAYNDYFQHLRNLYFARIENPTARDMKAFCPYLDMDEISGVNADRRRVYVAAPPVQVKDTCQVVRLEPSNASSPLSLVWEGAHRAGSSNPFDIHFIDRAITFTQRGWGELIQDSWNDFAKFMLDDPLVTNRDGDLKRKMVIWVCLNRNLEGIFNDDSAPMSILLDNAIVRMTTETVVACELKGCRDERMFWNCARCSGGLDTSSCTACGLKFRDDGWRYGWSTPLPQKLVEYAEANGHTFSTNPTVARDRHIKMHAQG
jgi:hypothetical protein